MNTLTKRPLAYILGILLAVVGAAFWAIDGMGNLTEQYTMGLYIALFLFLEAIGAGCLFAAAVSGSAQRGRLALIGTVSAIGSAAFILADLGSLDQAWRLFFGINLVSPLLLDVVFLSLCIICGIVLTVSIATENKRLDLIFSWVFKFLPILLVLGTAWFCVTIDGRPGWESPLSIADFIVHALLTGFLVLAVFDPDNRQTIRTCVILLAASLILTIGAIGVALYGTTSDALYTKALMTEGYAPLFWAQIIVGILVPLSMLAMHANRRLAALVAIFGVFAAKYLFVAKSQLFPLSHYGDGAIIPLAWKFESLEYIPSMGEIAASIGVIALCAAIVLFLWDKMTPSTPGLDI